MNNKNSNNLTYRIRSSLVIKLNLRLLGRLFSSFFSINLLIVLIGLFVTIWKAEEGAQDILDLIKVRREQIWNSYIVDKDYELTLDKSDDGHMLPASIQELLPFEIKDSKRDMILPEQNRNNGIFDRISSLKYAIDFSYGDTNYRIIYSIGQDIRILTYVLFGLLSFEMLLLIGNANKGFHVIKKTLKPLEDLTEKAKIINAEVSSMGSKAYDKYIKDLAGAISSIDANKLDKRITVDSSQNELKELASAINGMLHRINSSYQAQVRFVSDASHELRTPISVIQGYVNLLDRWGKDDPAVMQESIDAIKAEAENMKDLIEQLLFLARSDNDTINLQMDDFDCCDVVDEVVKETQMIDKSHSLEMDLNRPAYIHADRQLIKQAIRIFVDNSIKYTPNGNTIILRVEKKDNMVHIVVQDSGIGIHPKDLPHIFDRFYRSDESRARKTGGTGLGLSIAKWIIEKHDGYIEVLSRVNIGTRFTIVLPAKEVEEQKEG